jgi:hypothetical protein
MMRPMLVTNNHTLFSTIDSIESIAHKQPPKCKVRDPKLQGTANDWHAERPKYMYVQSIVAGSFASDTPLVFFDSLSDSEIPSKRA